MAEQVSDFLLKPAAEIPEGIALEFMGKGIRYGELASRAQRFAQGLSHIGLKPGDAIGLILPNIPQFVDALYGSWIRGAVVVPMNVLLMAPEVRYVVDDSQLRALVVYDAFLPQAEAAVADMANPPQIIVVGQAGRHISFDAMLAEEPHLEVAVLDDRRHVLTIYTSGTTGKPKGAVITNANVVSQLNMIDSKFAPLPDDRALCVLPLFHVFALNAVLNSGLRHRYTIVLHPKFDVAATLKSLQQDDISIFAGVPTMYFYLLKHAPAEAVFPRLRYCVSGGSAMPVEVLRNFEARFKGPVYEGYGLTESTVSVATNTEQERKIGSVGKAYSNVELKIVDEEGRALPENERGELLVRGPNIMQGYLNRPQESDEALKDGWLHTGDIAYLDEEGYLFIVDRKRDLIIKGGYNVYPREIEDVIYQLEGVAEAAVVGMHDDAKGESVYAFICPQPGVTLDEATVSEHLQKNLAKYKLPNRYVFLAELPKGPSNKILKRKLREWPDMTV